MGTSINITELEGRLSEVIARAEAGELFTVFRRNVPVARIGPAASTGADREMTSPGRPRSFSNVKGWLGDDDPFFAAIERRWARTDGRRISNG